MDGQVRPPQLTGTNYAYWKARTKVYLQAQGTRVWRAVINAWERPIVVKDEKPVALKPKSEWIVEESAKLEFNNKALIEYYHVKLG